MGLHSSYAEFFYDKEEQELFDSVEFPVTLESDPWEALMRTEFSDLNGDGNSDLTICFDDNGKDLKMVWIWDAQSEQFVYRTWDPEPGEADYGEVAPALMCDTLPFDGIDDLKPKNNWEGTYYCAESTEDGWITVVDMVQRSNWVYDVQTLEDYMGACALYLGNAPTYYDLTVEENAELSEKQSYPVYIVTYTAGDGDEAREWTVFTMDTDRYTYVFGIGAVHDAADEVKSVYEDIFDGLYLTDDWEGIAGTNAAG